MANNESPEYKKFIQQVQDLSDTDGSLLSPIDIAIENATAISLPKLSWINYNLPAKKMKLTNTAHTVILSAKWLQERPFLTSSALPGTYVFSQLHFHWGEKDTEGSEHTVNGKSLPLEMHVVHFRSTYITQEQALLEKDGLAVLVYFFQLGDPNPAMQTLVDAMKFVKPPHTSAHFPPKALSFFARPFDSNYFMYWGSVLTSSCRHRILWFISREPANISTVQMEAFRELQGIDKVPLKRNFRGVQPLNTRSFFLVNAMPPLNVTLGAIPTNPCQVLMNVDRGQKKDKEEGARVPLTMSDGSITDMGPFKRLRSCTNLQSPVNITSNSIQKKDFKPLTFDPPFWPKEGYATVTNTGHTATVHIHNRTLPMLTGGPLVGSYEFAEIHFHWGPDDSVGSEHLVDGQGFAMEAHVVNYLKTCGSFPEAARYVHGLCVIAIFLKACDDEHKDFAKITSQLSKIRRAFTSTDLTLDSLTWVESVLNQSYYTYPGSLTTPYKSTAVTWMVFPKPVCISHDQVNAFRELEEVPNNITQNYREVQPLNSRPIYYSE